MSYLEKITTGIREMPRRTVIHGEHGVGKSTWAAAWPNPIFLAIEDGVSNIDCHQIAGFQTFGEVLLALSELIEEADNHYYRTIVVDSIDWVERMILHQMREEHFDESYGKGVAEVASRISRLFDGLDAARDAGMHSVVIAHSHSRRVGNTEGASYDRIEPKLTKGACAVLCEWADEVVYAKMESVVNDEKLGFNQTRSIGITTGNRLLCLQPAAGYVASNRFVGESPREIDLSDVSKYFDMANVSRKIA